MNKIKELRTILKMPMSEIAKRAKCTITSVFLLEHNNDKIENSCVAKRIQKAFQINFCDENWVEKLNINKHKYIKTRRSKLLTAKQRKRQEALRYNLTAFRIHHDLRITHFARLINFDTSYLCKIENGTAKISKVLEKKFKQTTGINLKNYQKG